ncbi:MAG: GNAT family N-acetyltransferase [Bdellovibrionaceae bacterium]|nr:GNAT family N-acetyltransferase [Pseudobdellovibrionaceae bacterium]
METWSWKWGEDGDVPAVTQLVRSAYKELADRGLNYTATYQEEDVTRSRMNEGKTLLLLRNDEIVGTITARDENAVSKKKCAYLGQFGIKPELKRLGLGTKMMNMIEFWAQESGYECLQLDTAKPAAHLVDWYLSRGYEIVGETKFEGKTYESWIFEKPLPKK